LGNLTNLRDFLRHELPRDRRSQVDAIVTALDRASARYECYYSARANWQSYKNRRRKLGGILGSAGALLTDLMELDPVSRDDLEGRLGRDRIEALQGHLVNLRAETERVQRRVQWSGRPTDLARERWVRDVADIFEMNFKRKASISGSGGRATASRGKFHKLLELSMPASLPKHGTLDPRQLTRVLKRRTSRVK
jgi:hypothetical protein